jgi:peptidoglycan/LPS O-acetylase OafA/YrhL
MSWSFGAYLAERYVNGDRSPFAEHSAWLWTVIAFGCHLFKPTVTFSFPAFCFLTAIVISRWLSTGDKPIGLASSSILRSLSFVGLVSYSFYLIHAPFLVVAARLPRLLHAPDWFIPWKFFLLCLALSPITLFFSWCMYVVLEKGSIRMGKRVLARNLGLLEPTRSQQPSPNLSCAAKKGVSS